MLRTKHLILVTNTVFNIKIADVKSNIPEHAKDITIPEFNKLTGKNFAAILK